LCRAPAHRRRHAFLLDHLAEALAEFGLCRVERRDGVEPGMDAVRKSGRVGAAIDRQLCRFAQARLLSRNSASGTTRLTIPISSAVLASIASPK
jgi:hypothetical protein